ncbi:MAG: hypothetical protein ACOYEK_00235 [bacterium]
MPWKEISLMDQRMEFVHRVLTGAIPFLGFCWRRGGRFFCIVAGGRECRWSPGKELK